MTSGAPDYEHVFTLVTPVVGAGAPDWQDTAVGPGGTPIGGLTNPMTTEGDMIYGGTSGTPERLAAGTSGYILQTNGAGAAPTWVAASSTGYSLLASVKQTMAVSISSSSPTTLLTATGLGSGLCLVQVSFLLELTTGAATDWVHWTMNVPSVSLGTIGGGYQPGAVVSNSVTSHNFTLLSTPTASGGGSFTVTATCTSGATASMPAGVIGLGFEWGQMNVWSA